MALPVINVASGEIDSLIGASQAPLKSMMMEEYETWEKASMLPNFFQMTDSEHWGEKYGSMNDNFGMKPMEENGEIHSSDMKEGHAKVIKNYEWSDSVSISYAAVSDDMTKTLKQAGKKLPRGYHRARERFGAAMYGGAIMGQKQITFEKMAFDISCADGGCLFSTEHVSAFDKKLKFCNKYADEFSLKALTRMETEMTNLTDDAENEIDVEPNTIVIPNDAEMIETVLSCLGADKEPSTANNARNIEYGRWNIIIWKYLNRFLTADMKPWMLMDVERNQMVDGAIFQDRAPLEINSTVQRNKTNTWDAWARFSAGFVDWRFVSVGGIAGGKQLVT